MIHSVFFIIEFLHPDFKIQRQDWFHIWKVRKDQIFRNIVSRNLAISGCGFFIHPFLIEIPGKAQNLNYFIFARFLSSFLVFTTAVLLKSKIITHYNRLYISLVFFVCLIQGFCLNWDSRLPSLFSIAIPFVFAILSFSSFFEKLMFFIVGLGIQMPFLFMNRLYSDEMMTFLSLVIITIFIIANLSAGYAFEVEKFQSDQKFIEQIERTQEIQKDFLSAIQSLISGTIYRRVYHFYFDKRMNISQALDQVISMKPATVSVVHSDIRDWSENSKDVEFILKRVIPNKKRIVHVGEVYGAVTRLIGDLVFSYFDEEQGSHQTIISSILFGFEILEIVATSNSNELNQSSILKRYVLISHGDAVVGNIGNTGGSSEITCLGKPSNILDRIDKMTKEPPLNTINPEKFIIITSSAAIALSQFCPDIELNVYDLEAAGVSIRNHPEETKLYSIEFNHMNKFKLLEIYKTFKKEF